MSELRKKISIASTAPLITYGGIMGPIRRPFYETISNISILISGGAEVYEHIGDKKIKLDMLNFDADNAIEKVAENAPLARAVSQDKENAADSIIRISTNSNKNQNHKNKQKEKFYNEKVQPQVEKTVDQAITQE